MWLVVNSLVSVSSINKDESRICSNQTKASKIGYWEIQMQCHAKAFAIVGWYTMLKDGLSSYFWRSTMNTVTELS